MATMTSASSDEILYMNYMKFFGILYLLIWHTAIRGLNVFVISFFLQMFFFVSGYFYKEIYSDNPLVFIRKRLKTLYVPFVVYCLILLALNNLFVDIYVYSKQMYLPFNAILKHLIGILTLESNLQLSGAMWFVSSLFLSSVLFCVISAVLKKIVSFTGYHDKYESIRFLILLLLFLGANYLSLVKVILPRYLDISLVLMFFYYLGYLYHKYEKQIQFNFFIALSSLFTILICIKYGYPQFAQRKYVDPSYVLVCGIAGIYLNIYISKLFASCWRIEFVNYAGKNTMVVLAMHFLAFKLVSLIIIYTQNLPLELLSSFPVLKSANQGYRWLYAATGLLVPLAGKYLIDKGFCKTKQHLRSQFGVHC